MRERGESLFFFLLTHLEKNIVIHYSGIYHSENLMYLTFVVLIMIFIHGLILYMLNSGRLLMNSIHETPYLLRGMSFLSIIRTFRVNLIQYGLIWFVIIVNSVTKALDLIEYRNVGIIYIVILSVVTLTALLAWFLSELDHVNLKVISFMLFLLMLFNVIAILYVAFVGFIIY